MVEFNSTSVHATADNSSSWSGPQVGQRVEQEGLLFEDATGQAKLVSSEALANLFKLFSNRTECVVLNACYSQFQAEAIAEHSLKWIKSSLALVSQRLPIHKS